MQIKAKARRVRTFGGHLGAFEKWWRLRGHPEAFEEMGCSNLGSHQCSSEAEGVILECFRELLGAVEILLELLMLSWSQMDIMDISGGYLGAG